MRMLFQQSKSLEGISNIFKKKGKILPCSNVFALSAMPVSKSILRVVWWKNIHCADRLKGVTTALSNLKRRTFHNYKVPRIYNDDTKR